jgi:hypothetical protein
VLATIDVCDALVTQLDKVIDDQPHSLVVSGANDIDAVRADSTAHRNHRDAGGKIIKCRLGKLRT